MRKIDLHQMPYTIKNSYMVLSDITENYQGYGNRAGLYLRTIHNSTLTPLIAKVTFAANGAPVTEETYLQDTGLSFGQVNPQIECCFADDCTILIRGRAGISLELDFLTDNGPYDYIYEVEKGDLTLYMANCYKNNNRYLVWLQMGTCELDQKWEESSSLYSKLKITGEDGFLCIIKEIETEWDQVVPVYDFEEARAHTQRDFLAFYEKMPTLSVAYEELGYMAAYLDWSSIVRPNGFLHREAMYMSKNWMTNVWSWDHCFNAMALSYENPALAWDTYMIMADFQDATGRLPDSVSDNHIIWNYCKPPVHGWALRKMTEHMQLMREQEEEAYAFLSKWTTWWMQYRRRDGLYYYNHGNDSGWDNSTAFSELPPIATPELQADMIVQMDVLSELAGKLGKDAEAITWKQESDAHLELFLQRCFREDLPVAIQLSTGKIVENQSLLPYEVLILGEKLPVAIREKIIDIVGGDRYLTKYGLATESSQSVYYREDGYWRGPIWAPSTMIMVDGLDRCGRKDLAKEIAKRFADMTAMSGFAENFNALTGEGLRDLAYTWTASVAIVMVKEYLSK